MTPDEENTVLKTHFDYCKAIEDLFGDYPIEAQGAVLSTVVGSIIAGCFAPDQHEDVLQVHIETVRMTMQVITAQKLLKERAN